MQTLYVNTASTVGTQDGTTNTPGSSGTAAFATLRQAIDSLGTLSDQTTIYCTGTAADTSDLSQTPWDFVTSATNYLLITTQGADRPGTTYSTSKYRIEKTGANGIYSNTACHVRFDGLQIKVTASSGTWVCLKTTNANQTASDIDMRVSNCIIVGVPSGTANIIAYNSRPTSGTVSKNIFVNCVAIGATNGFTEDESSAHFYNCGAYNCQYGFVASAAFVVKNCIAYGGDIQFVDGGSGWGTGTDYNAGTDGSETAQAAPTGIGTNSRPSTSFTFTNAAGDDFSLTTADAGARNYGTDLSADSYYAFSTDLVGTARPAGSWDIGPFEATTIYTLMGQACL